LVLYKNIWVNLRKLKNKSIMITRKELFAKALMIEKPWFIEDIEFEPEESKLEIWINYEQGCIFSGCILKIKR